MDPEASHIRDRMAGVIGELEQLVRDIQSLNDYRPDCDPIDCERDRVLLSLARQAAAEWDAGNFSAAGQTWLRLDAQTAGYADD